MPRTSQGSSQNPGKHRPAAPAGLSSKGGRFVIIAARFNDSIVQGLIDGALEALGQTGTPGVEVAVIRVPGAFELPLAARRLAELGAHDAIIALGCVIRGETAHFEYVSGAATDGLGRVSLDYGIPVGFGVLTTESHQQAMDRSGGVLGNSGFDAAMAVVQMVQVLKELS